MTNACLGPAYSSSDVVSLLRDMEINGTDFRDNEAGLFEATVARLSAGKVVGWFNGRMEFGPRALGGRSILADPRDPNMRDRINKLLKKRESFRPFAPAVLASRAQEHFDIDRSSPFMLLVCKVVSKLDLPAITHVDGSARIQTVDSGTSPRFAGLLEHFERETGCPILLNTSFNMRNEPIVQHPAEAIQCFIRSGLDSLVLEDFLIDREDINPLTLDLIEDTSPGMGPLVSQNVYTFW
jgi:carbamoyltransferase